MTSTSGEKAERIAIVLHSGSYDRASYALSLATVGLAIGMEAHVLLVYGGLGRFVKGHLEDMEDETEADVKGFIAKGLRSGGIQSLEAQLKDARRLGLKIYACAGSMANMNIARQDLREEVDEVMGLVTFLKFARTAAVNYYI
ncbi:MAG: DsrE/DsrF/DrsH-like family protein [Chloroflexi bacterium]|nr:DsrE/DsrF/DrsH-like family protein [Chloroflexota bacterium]